MKLLELQEYAKKNGFDSLKFRFINLFGGYVYGEWIDAYFGFFVLEGMDKNKTLSVSTWIKEFGNELFNFEPIKEKE